MRPEAVVSIVAAGSLMSYVAATSGICLAVAFNMLAWKRAVLVPIPKENVDKEKSTHWFVAGIAVLAALFG
jgi:beta-lactamase regulating signal transducer with metallopeptidase domain